MFERCTSLERVHVAGRNAVYFRAALEPQALEEPQDTLTPERLFLRQLKSLQVTEVDFGVNEDDQSFFDLLDYCLRLRLRIIKTAQLGKSDSDVYRKLESLVIARCKVPMKFLPAVREIVQDLRSEVVQIVSWDGEIEEENNETDETDETEEDEEDGEDEDEDEDEEDEE
ncbi:hypothetical protein EWM64_g9881 [Hericium alpestre]|uniref:Uncharacterized protein n=1 Tax=Hericium alpestre TaxID=135208 RepID=A0A4Y9ZJV6_9AGAM|nr:hypothetical protein EWM64_g9881 [Hericium alpestre]